jgi:hypothetical protein
MTNCGLIVALAFAAAGLADAFVYYRHCFEP